MIDYGILLKLISTSEKSSLPSIVYYNDYHIDGLALMTDSVNLPKTECVDLSSEDLVETNREYKSYAQNFKGQVIM